MVMAEVEKADKRREFLRQVHNNQEIILGLRMRSAMKSKGAGMTREQAIAVANVLREIDNGCLYCVGGACEGMSEIGLGWTWAVAEDEQGRAVYDDDRRPEIVVSPQS